MSQIFSSLPNKFEQGIFAALCFDFSLSKNFWSIFCHRWLISLFYSPLTFYFRLTDCCRDWECKGKYIFYTCNFFLKKNSKYFYSTSKTIHYQLDSKSKKMKVFLTWSDDQNRIFSIKMIKYLWIRAEENCAFFYLI